MNHSAQLRQTLGFGGINIAHMHWPTVCQQVRRHSAAHIAYTDDANGVSQRMHRLLQDCTNRLDLLTDIKMPMPIPSVTIAVPP